MKLAKKTGTAIIANGFKLGAITVAMLGFLEAQATTGTMLISASTTLTENHYGNIIITADSVGLNCDNYTVEGSGTGFGIDVVGRTKVKVINCNVKDFGVGFRIKNSTNSTFVANSATGSISTTGGFYILDCPSGIRLQKNVSNFNTVGRGFSIRNSSKVELLENKAHDNGFRGFDIGDSTAVKILKNMAYKNGSAGFVAYSSSQLGFKMNHARGNASEGFALLNITDSTFDMNVAVGNGTAGYRVSGGTANIFRKNEAQQNTYVGFNIQSAGNGFKKNSAFGNGLPYDLLDASCPAVTNTWTANLFGSASCPAIN